MLEHLYSSPQSLESVGSHRPRSTITGAVVVVGVVVVVVVGVVVVVVVDVDSLSADKEV